MESDKDRIKKLFSSKLKNFEPELPDFMWERINSNLSSPDIDNKPQLPLEKHRRKSPIALWLSGIAAVAIVFLVIWGFPQPREAKQICQISQQFSLKKDFLALTKKPLFINKKQQIVKDIVHPLQKNNSTPKILASSKTHSPDILPIYPKDSLSDNRANISIVQSSEILIAETDLNKHPIENNRDIEKDLADKIAAFVAEGEGLNNLLADNTIAPEPEREKTKQTGNGFSLGVSGGGSFSKGAEIQNQLRLASIGVDEDGNPINGYTRQRMRLEHNQPINFGIHVSKQLSRRLSIESGIQYAYISSKNKTAEQDKKNNSKDVQYFHYLGFPLSLNYNFFEWKKLQLYLTAGGVVQKDIYGRLRTDQSLNSVGEYKSMHISQNHPQFSTNASLGISYPIYGKMSLYSNVGAAYYFKTENKYETIYSDRKWIFNLNFGIKFGF